MANKGNSTLALDREMIGSLYQFLKYARQGVEEHMKTLDGAYQYITDEENFSGSDAEAPQEAVKQAHNACEIILKYLNVVEASTKYLSEAYGAVASEYGKDLKEATMSLTAAKQKIKEVEKK